MHRIIVSSILAAVLIDGAAPAPLPAAEVSVLLTRIDDGDTKRAALENGDAWSYGIHQDDAYALLRPGTTPITATDPGAPIAIAIDRNTTFQTMLGYGGAMTDSAAFVLQQLKAKDAALYAYTMGRLFSPTDGAGFAVLRLAMGASDYVSAKSYYTYCDQESTDLAGFSIDRDRESIIPTLKDALALDPGITLIASPWSPPAWMKTNHDLKGISEADKAKGATCRLRPECFPVYADYFVRFIEAYREAGITINAVTLQNEPQNDGSDYPCLRMDEDEQIKLVAELGPKLAAHKLATRILVHDHNWVLHPNDRKVVGGDAKTPPLASVTKMLSDPVAAKYIDGSAWHCYSGGAGDMQHVYEAIHAAFPASHLLTTELSGWGRKRGAWWGDVEWGMAHAWFGPAQHWSEASLEWNIALDHRFGPTLRGNSEAMGLVTVKTDGFKDVKFEREFYAMAQLSRAARPGARRIAATISAGRGGGLDLLAFTLPQGGTSLVVFNRNPGESAIQVADHGAWFAYHLPGHAIATFVW